MELLKVIVASPEENSPFSRTSSLRCLPSRPRALRIGCNITGSSYSQSPLLGRHGGQFGLRHPHSVGQESAHYSSNTTREPRPRFYQAAGQESTQADARCRVFCSHEKQLEFTDGGKRAACIWRHTRGSNLLARLGFE